MPTYKDWKIAAEDLSDEEAIAIIDGIDKLLEWDFFDKHFGWTRIRDVRHAVMHMMDIRHPAK